MTAEGCIGQAACSYRALGGERPAGASSGPLCRAHGTPCSVSVCHCDEGTEQAAAFAGEDLGRPAAVEFGARDFSRRDDASGAFAQSRAEGFEPLGQLALMPTEGEDA